MKSKEELIEEMKSTLADLQTGCTACNPGLHIWFLHKLEFLADVLGDEAPEQYRKQAEEFLRKDDAE